MINCSSPAQSTHLTVPYGHVAVLPCDGSAFVDEEDVDVSWEAMGRDDRVFFAPDDLILGGSWSLLLESPMLSDTNMYECIWRGRRTLSTVWLSVERPVVDSVVEVSPGSGTVTLPCYLELPKNQNPLDLNVWWESNGMVMIERIKNQLDIFSDIRFSNETDFDYFDSRNFDKFPLPLYKSEVFYPAEYTCWYRTSEGAEAKPGIPGTVSIVPKWPTHNTEVTENPTEDDWSSGWFWSNTEETITNETEIFIDSFTLPSEVSVSTDFLPMEANEETATSYPEQAHREDSEEDIDWTDFPWVRTGLIAGVLLVTAAVLCILGVLHKL
ncbi:hypothetical protein WMY93_032795 [Mugilogobius chulae]|uniref:Ig-like domain-containing protein n=1 Tax=Mugilogobius chulae TaxID=88201 RepID=A0AAW0MJU3_9GOBI